MTPEPTATREAVDVAALLSRVDPAEEMAPCHLRSLLLGDVIDAVSDVVADLVAERAARGRPTVVLLVDKTTILRDGRDVKADVAARLGERFAVTTTVLDDGHRELHVVEEVLVAATEAVTGADAVVALGGGTVSDIGKVAVQRAAAAGPGAPRLVTVQTAASVDGYTDDVSVVLRGGVKRTVPSAWPDAVIADAVTIAQAPSAMNRAGFGEMTSMLVAPADWRLASLVGFDRGFKEGPIRLLAVAGDGLETWSRGVARADPEAVERLTRALALRGIASGVAGSTAVLSGVEHVVSHMVDQHHTQRHEPMGLHGAQVGAASVVAAAAWEMLFDRLDGGIVPEPVLDELDPDVARPKVERAFAHLDADGTIVAECWSDYAAKIARLRENLDDIRGLVRDWGVHREDLARLRTSSERIAAGLRAAGSAVTFAELDPVVPPELARWAVENCGLMRNRLTLVDVLTVLGWWTPADVDEVLARTARAVAAADRVEA